MTPETHLWEAMSLAFKDLLLCHLTFVNTI